MRCKFSAGATNGFKMWRNLISNDYVIGSAQEICTFTVLNAGSDIIAQ